VSVLKTFVQEYLVRFYKLRVTDLVEILIIAWLIYIFIKWVRTTRAWALMRGIFLLVIFWLAAWIFNFHVIQWLFVNALSVGITAIIIIFQPELRKVLEQLGQRNIMSPIFTISSNRDKSERFTDKTIEEIAVASTDLAKVKTGALIVIEQEVKLGEYISTGIDIDAMVSRQLLINIFEYNTPLHDGAVIVRGNRILAATCYLPLSDNMQLSKELGTRHRAGVGISENTDSFTIIVSEETGKISIARGGELIRGVDGEYLRAKLHEIQKRSLQDEKKSSLWKRITAPMKMSDSENKNDDLF
jgi:diadenylate cyclase